MNAKTWDEFQQACYDNAEEHGFHKDDDYEDKELMSLQISRRLLHIIREVSEAHDLHHRGYEPAAEWLVGEKPEGMSIELADVVIRVADMAATYGIDLGSAIERKMKYNKGREFLHGKAY